MKKFWKATLIPGICCLLAGAVLAIILLVGFRDELINQWDEFSITEDNFYEYFQIDEFMSFSREGIHYSKYDTKESYYYEVPKDEAITGINFEFAVGEVKIVSGDSMELTVTDMFENAISSEVRNGVWFIEDSLMDSGSVHDGYSPNITITVPKEQMYDTMEVCLAAGRLEAEELSAEEVHLEVDAGSMKVFQLTAEHSLKLTNGVGEIRIYDAAANNLEVDNGIGAVSIAGAISGQNEVNCGIGEVKLTLTDRKEVDFNYSVECGIGGVKIDGRSFNGDAESNRFNRADADYFALECGIGHIEINLNEN